MKKFFLVQFLIIIFIMGISIHPVLADDGGASSVFQGGDEFISAGREWRRRFQFSGH